MKFSIYIFVSILFTTLISFSKSSYVNQIPNGSVNSCATCHVSNSNYNLNSFGNSVKNGYLSSGKVNWKSALANIDSDGDSFTNGAELQDPNGTWTSGSANPGDKNKVSNPGVKASIPTSVDDKNFNSSLSIQSIYPNPFKENVEIIINDFLNVNLNVKIYNEVGDLVKFLINNNYQLGVQKFYWDGTDNNGFKVNSGIYYLIINSESKYLSQAIIYNK